MRYSTCTLPAGYVDIHGFFHRDVELTSLSGRDEEFLASIEGKETASKVTALLSRCIHRIGTISPVSEEVARSLLVADRQYLLIKLREATFGSTVQATISCPWPDCGKKVDMDFSLQHIPVKESPQKAAFYTYTLSREAAFIGDNQEPYHEVTFRLPNGGDQEAVSCFVYKNEAKALTMLLVRCIQSIGPVNNPGYETVVRLSPFARMEIENMMEQCAPFVDLTIAAQCPECGREFVVPFDIHDFFFGQMRISLDLLYREVHYLAYHYHWSEKEIMEMPRHRRRNYISVLADEIERLNNAVS